MYHFAYLGFDLPFVAAALLLLARAHREVRIRALKLGAIGGAAGVLSEYFYFKDYWRPPTLFGAGHASVEDVLFGASVMIISVLAYPVLWHQQLTGGRSSLKKGALIAALYFAVGIVVGNLWLGINSIFISSGMFAALAGYAAMRRTDLVRPALATACLLTLLALLIYIFAFDVVWPDFWNRYWLLHGTRWGGEILGNIPLTELLWYFCWGLFGGVYVPFLSGARFRKDDL